ncbi:MAG: hypothetical protein D6714_04795 [Bacteroidetes bacterium]|nr:MAG: hypothetical protein D6714_04795 [Bacteroidota bacterium]
MTQLSFFKYAVALLFLLNIGMVGFFFLTKPPAPQAHNLLRSAPKMLNLDEKQKETFQALARQHQEKMRELDRKHAELLEAYFSTFTEKSPGVSPDSLLHEAANIERAKIAATYQHFEDVKNILRPEQMPQFDKFMDQVLHQVLLPPKKERSGPPPPPQ